MTNLSLYYQSGVFYNFFFNKQIPVVTNIYLGLSSGVPTDIYNGGELSIGNYARQNVGVGQSNWSYDLNNGIIYNNNQISFPSPTTNWGWVSGIVLYDGPTNSANPIFYSPITGIELKSSYQFSVPISGLSLRNNP